MHCSANVGEDGDTAIFFRLSGTGKTTLSADPDSKLIVDDEHGWAADNTVFDFEGGCHAKVIDLSQEKEPDVYRAIRPNALLMTDAGVNVWFINTGWSGGPYGVGSRIILKYTRSLVSAILKGELDNVEYHQLPNFSLYMPQPCNLVPTEMLNPMNTWLQKAAYVRKSMHLAHSFHLNFDKFIDQPSHETRIGGTLIDVHQIMGNHLQ